MAKGRISPVTGRYITIDVEDPTLGGEYKVFYLENGEGRPLVCQHTAGCHNHQWRDLLEDAEITKDYRVIAYDLPRHGKSENYPVFRKYLVQALERIEARLGATV